MVVDLSLSMNSTIDAVVSAILKLDSESMIRSQRCGLLFPATALYDSQARTTRTSVIHADNFPLFKKHGDRASNGHWSEVVVVYDSRNTVGHDVGSAVDRFSLRNADTLQNVSAAHANHVVGDL